MGHHSSDGTAAMDYLFVATESYRPSVHRRIVIMALWEDSLLGLLPKMVDQNFFCKIAYEEMLLVHTWYPSHKGLQVTIYFYLECCGTDNNVWSLNATDYGG
jgi:hypothetical protein